MISKLNITMKSQNVEHSNVHKHKVNMLRTVIIYNSNKISDRSLFIINQIKKEKKNIDKRN